VRCGVCALGPPGGFVQSATPVKRCGQRRTDWNAVDWRPSDGSRWHGGSSVGGSLFIFPNHFVSHDSREERGRQQKLGVMEVSLSSWLALSPLQGASLPRGFFPRWCAYARKGSRPSLLRLHCTRLHAHIHAHALETKEQNKTSQPTHTLFAYHISLSLLLAPFNYDDGLVFLDILSWLLTVGVLSSPSII